MTAPAQAALVKSDFLSAGDGLLVTDTATNTQWLSPYFTRGQSLNTVLSGYGNLLTTHGFSVAGHDSVSALIDTNFDSPPSSPGTPQGYVAAQNFFNTFGINEYVTCFSSFTPVPCPRTSGFTLDGTSVSGLGMLQFGTNGYKLDFAAGVLPGGGNYADLQLGTWLSRAAPPPPPIITSGAPEPAAWGLMILGFGATGATLRRRRAYAGAV